MQNAAATLLQNFNPSPPRGPLYSNTRLRRVELYLPPIDLHWLPSQLGNKKEKILKRDGEREKNERGEGEGRVIEREGEREGGREEEREKREGERVRKRLRGRGRERDGGKERERERERKGEREGGRI